MRRTQHTPGPWDAHGATIFYATPDKADAVEMIEIRANVTEDGWDTVAFIEATWPKARHNARLIAAAPRLLDAAELVIERWAQGDLADAVRMLDAAVAEAKADNLLTKDISPIEAANAITPDWMRNIRDFDALEIAPCRVVGHDSLGNEIVEPCDDAPEEAAFWTVYGHYKSGGVDAFEDFATEGEAVAFHDRLIAGYPHLARGEG